MRTARSSTIYTTVAIRCQHGGGGGSSSTDQVWTDLQSSWHQMSLAGPFLYSEMHVWGDWGWEGAPVQWGPMSRKGV